MIRHCMIIGNKVAVVHLNATSEFNRSYSAGLRVYHNAHYGGWKYLAKLAKFPDRRTKDIIEQQVLTILR